MEPVIENLMLGDIVVFPIDRINVFGAAHVIATEPDHATISVLDWVGAEPPETAAELAGVPRMIRDFMSWQPQEMVRRVPRVVPGRAVRIGSLPVSDSETQPASGGWSVEADIVAQREWDDLPSTLTGAYKAAADDDERMLTPHLLDAKTGAPAEIEARHTGAFREGAGYRTTDEFQMASLLRWPRLSEIVLQSWREDLIPFLENAPLVRELILAGHAPDIVDLSGSRLRRVSIDGTGVRRLRLPDTLDTLILRGTPARELHVDVIDEGRWLEVQFPGGVVVPTTGMSQLRWLRVHGIRDMSASAIATHHPNVRSLMLYGAPGAVREVTSLAELSALEVLWMEDLFGYTAEQFDPLGDLVSLRVLDLTSVPANVAAHAKRWSRTRPDLDVAVRRPRSPGWIQENLDNPMRAWPDRTDIPSTVSRTIPAAWRKALRGVHRAEGDPAKGACISEFLDIVRDADIDQGCLDPASREELVAAVDMLTELVPPGLRDALRARIDTVLG